MIVIAGSVAIRPESRELAIELANTMARATRAEVGCLKYEFFSSTEDPNRFFVFEEWTDVAALRAHFETPHMAEFDARLPEVVAGKFEILRYDVANTTTDFLA